MPADSHRRRRTGRGAGLERATGRTRIRPGKSPRGAGPRPAAAPAPCQGPAGLPAPFRPAGEHQPPARGSPRPRLHSPPSPLPAGVPRAPRSCSSLQTWNWVLFKKKKTNSSADIPASSKFISAGEVEGQPLSLTRERSSSGGACAGAGELAQQPGGAGTAAPGPSNSPLVAPAEALCLFL